MTTLETGVAAHSAPTLGLGLEGRRRQAAEVAFRATPAHLRVGGPARFGGGKRRVDRNPSRNATRRVQLAPQGSRQMAVGVGESGVRDVALAGLGVEKRGLHVFQEVLVVPLLFHRQADKRARRVFGHVEGGKRGGKRGKTGVCCVFGHEFCCTVGVCQNFQLKI